jgi:hypothetical protein
LEDIAARLAVEPNAPPSSSCTMTRRFSIHERGKPPFGRADMGQECDADCVLVHQESSQDQGYAN